MKRIRRVYWAPEKLPDDLRHSVFLAGSIEMGEAPDWQDTTGERLAAVGITVLNPRRRDWDSSWIASILNPQFREQVEWELAAQERTAVILMNILPETKAPISLLELGLFARTRKMIVVCPEGFWKKGNVDIVCKRYGACQVDELEDALVLIEGWARSGKF